VLTKLGANPDDLAIVLGIEPKAVREKRQADDKAERDRMRKDWEDGQKFDAAERERIKQESKKDLQPAPAPAPITAGVKATVTTKDATTLGLLYTNINAMPATVKIRIGTVDRPDRLIAAGKTATSTYTTTVKAGFAGQRIVVTHAESGIVILDQVL
jgi:hypothetical protein